MVFSLGVIVPRSHTVGRNATGRKAESGFSSDQHFVKSNEGR